MNIKEFNQVIQKYTKTLVPEQIVLMQKKIVFEGLARVVQKTPIDTGRARGGWQVGVGFSPETELDVEDKDGQMTIGEGMTKINTIPLFAFVSIANNVSYIKYLEGGSSQRQAPQGMVGLTLEELRTMFP